VDFPILAAGSAVVTGELLGLSLRGLSLSRPLAHEQRVADTVQHAPVAAALPQPPTLRVLRSSPHQDLIRTKSRWVKR